MGNGMTDHPTISNGREDNLPIPIYDCSNDDTRERINGFHLKVAPEQQKIRDSNENEIDGVHNSHC
jgi:hypothetical protein